MPKPRQAQKKKDGTQFNPKPLCENEEKHEEPVIMDRFWISGRNEKGNRCWIKRGWICPICDEVIIDQK